MIIVVSGEIYKYFNQVISCKMILKNLVLWEGGKTRITH